MTLEESCKKSQYDYFGGPDSTYESDEKTLT
jgi:hypothetical protein